MTINKTLNWAALAMGIAVAVPLSVVSASAHAAAAISSGTGAYASASTSDNCPSYCVGGPDASAQDGGEGSSSASASVNSASGTAMGSALLSAAANGLPELHAYGQSGLGRGADGYAVAAQGYDYLGATARTVTIDLLMDGSAVENAGGYSFANLQAAAAVFMAPSLNWTSHYATMVYELNGSPEVTWGDSNSGGSAPLTGQLSFTVNPGDTFFVVAMLAANGYNGTADAWNTLHATFDNPANLQPIAAPVPEPGALWLMLAGVPLLALARRRAKRGA